jgi:peptide methionine sulfoxide reductase MsrB
MATMPEPEKRCGNCDYHRGHVLPLADDTGEPVACRACRNTDSPWSARWTSISDTCREWREREEE